MSAEASAKQTPHPSAVKRWIEGLPQCLTRENAAVLLQLTGIVNREQRKAFTASKPVKRWFRNLGNGSLKSNGETIARFYSVSRVRAEMLQAVLRVRNANGPAAVSDYLPSLDYCILASRFPRMLDAQFDRLALEATFDAEERLRPDVSQFFAAIESTPTDLQSVWMLWPDLQASLSRWLELSSAEQESVVLGLLVLITIGQKLAPVECAQRRVSALAGEFVALRVVPAENDVATREMESPNLQLLWSSRLQELIEAATSLTAEIPSVAALEPLRARIDALASLAERFQTESLSDTGLSTEEFFEQLNRLAAIHAAPWLTSLVQEAKLSWSQVSQDQKQIAIPELREALLDQIEAALERCAALTLNRTQLAEQIKATEAQMPGDLEGRRRAREQLRQLGAERNALDREIEQLEHDTQRLLIPPTENPATPATTEGEAFPVPTPGTHPPASDEGRSDCDTVATQTPDSTLPPLVVESLPTDVGDKRVGVAVEITESAPHSPLSVAAPGTTPQQLAQEFLAGADTPEVRYQQQANLLWALVDQGYLLSAYWYLESLRLAELVAPALPVAHLFKAAAFARFVGDDTSIAASAYADTLMSVEMRQLERLFEERRTPGLCGLGLAASLQPALFFPLSGAPQLLRASNHNFPPHLSALLTEIASLGEQAIACTLYDLGGYQQDADVSARLAALQEEVKTFRNHAQQRQTGYFWAVAALKHALSKGTLAPVLDALLLNRTSSLESVRTVIRQCATRESLEELLIESDRAQEGRDTRFARPIVGNARNHFIAQVQRFLQFAVHWVELQERQAAQRDASHRLERVRPVIQRLGTQIQPAIEYFHRCMEEAQTLEDSAGSHVACEALIALSELFRSQKPRAWDTQDLQDWLQLPRRLAGDRRDTRGSPATAIAIAEFARTGFAYGAWAKRSIDGGNLKLATTALREMERIGAPHPELEELRRALRSQSHTSLRNFAEQVKRTESRLNDAFQANLLTDMDYQSYRALLEELEGQASVDAYVDYPQLQAELEDIGRFLNESSSSRLSQLREEARTLRAKLDESLRQDEVPPGWIDEMERSLNEANLTVAEEYLGQLRAFLEDNATLLDLREKGLHALTQFRLREPEISAALNGKGRRELARRIAEGQSVGPADFAPITDRPGDALRAFDTLSKLKRRFSASDIEALYAILAALGFGAPECDLNAIAASAPGETVEGMHYVRLPLKVGERESPIPALGSQRGGHYHVLAVTRMRTLDEIRQFVEAQQISAEPVILILIQRVDRSNRLAFWQFCHKHRLTLLPIDEALLLYVAAQPQDMRSESRLRRALRVALAFTYANPYVNSMQPPAPEMFFGREDKIAEVLRPGGAAILYGGRQMGKSSILEQLRRRLHKPQLDQYAWYHGIDSADIETLTYLRLVERFWSRIEDDLVRDRLLDLNPSERRSVPAVIRNLLSRKENLHVLLILDEADKFIDLDSRHDFAVFRELRELFYQSSGRFRVVTAGLANVQRYALMPNFPLTQLGSTVQVGIMSITDAVRLIRDPLSALGYTFRDMGSINRILAYTNRHPGLIQVFCHHLCEHLNQQTAAGAVAEPGYEISDRDIAATYEKKTVRREIVERFNMTLRLDPHYPVLAYGVIIEGIGLQEFNLAGASLVGAQYWPEEFGERMPNSKLRAILDEMVGLGVLYHRQDTVTAEDLYRLANTNVLRLLGTESEMRKELDDIRLNRELQNPMQYHRLLEGQRGREKGGRNLRQRSPFTVGEELQISGYRSGVEGMRAARDDARQWFNVSLVFGSRAAGIDRAARALESLHQLDGDGQRPPYRLRVVPAEKTTSIQQLRRWTEGVGGRNTEAAILKIDMPCVMGDAGLHSEILEHVYGLRPASSRGALRVVLTFDPAATWQWLGSPEHEAVERETTSIHLLPWTRGAVRVWLADLHLMDAPRQRDFVLSQTGSWFVLLESLERVAMKSSDTDDPEKLTEWSAELPSNLDPPGAERSLAQFGVSACAQAREILTDLISNKIASEFDRDWLNLVVSDKPQYAQTPTEQFLAWCLRLGIIHRVAGRQAGSEVFTLDPVLHSLLERARLS